ncbi:MAG: carbon-nitrogen hydrolase family protein [Dehalococcoidia bacterium]|nr:carbon-nitrogen hydrolase family protein [Dehalococcoidia bacterium]
MTRTARIALLQLRAFDVEDAARSLEHTLAMVDEAAEQRPDIIALPEVTYPAYFLGRAQLDQPAVLAPAAAEARFAEKARQHRTHIAAGMASEAPAGASARYCNGAVLFGRDGDVIGRTAKSFLWHFDRRWFTAGAAYPVFETDAGRIGMLVCADGRVPEIARSLVLGGAEIILDLTAWVSSGRDARALTSSQRTYLMPTRAAENGVWVAAADKVGVEARSIVYCGGSCVVDPRGQYVAQLNSTDEGILRFDVPLDETATPIRRRPELYDALGWPTERLPVEAQRGEPLVVGDWERYIAAVQMRVPDDGAAFLDLARRHVERLALHDARLVLFPATPVRLRAAYRHDELLAGVRRIAADSGVIVAFTAPEPDGAGPRAMYLVGADGVLARHRQTHTRPGARFETVPLGDEPCPVIETPLGRVGLMVGAEGFVPEVARSLMLRGAEIILWCGDDPALAMAPVVRTRADENRVFVACAAAPSATGATMIVAPSGAVLAEALEGCDLAVGATVNRAWAHLKERAPGSDVVLARQPGTYGALLRVTAAAPARVV